MTQRSLRMPAHGLTPVLREVYMTIVCDSNNMEV